MDPYLGNMEHMRNPIVNWAINNIQEKIFRLFHALGSRVLCPNIKNQSKSCCPVDENYL